MRVLEKIRERKNRIIAAGIIAAGEAQSEADRGPRSAKSLRAKKIVATICSMAIAGVMLCTTVFADEGITKDSAIKFFTDAAGALQTVIILIGAGVGIWGIVNLLEGYGNDNAGAKSQGMKQLMAGIGVAAVGFIGVPALTTLMKEGMGGT